MDDYELKAKACTTVREARALYYAAPFVSTAEKVYRARWDELEKIEETQDVVKDAQRKSKEIALKISENIEDPAERKIIQDMLNDLMP